MAAPTSVRVEGQSMTTTVLRWEYAGTAIVEVYRSTDGSSYSLVDSTTAAALTYTDVGLDSGTKYYYKLSDDSGSTFSSVVSTYTHFCADQSVAKTFALPRFDEGQEDPSYKLNELAERVERALGDQLLAPDVCYICPDDGAVVIDCTDGCNSFFIIADEDINSFTINRCGNSDPRIDIYVPPNTTRAICGFPPGYGFGGDECTEAPISGGSLGRTLSIGGSGAAGGGGGAGGKAAPGKPKTGQSGGSGGGGGGSGCECVPGRNNELTLKCCSSNCSMNCSSTKTITIKVCGGIGPYAFEHTGSVKFKTGNTSTADEVTIPRGAQSNSVTVVPPANAGPSVSGTAYRLGENAQFFAFGNCEVVTCHWNMSCNDVQLSTGGGNGCFVCDSGGGVVRTGDCRGTPGVCGDAPCTGCTTTYLPGECDPSKGCIQDIRTAQMISDGCAPCGLQAGSIITVTDAAGVSVSISLKA